MRTLSIAGAIALAACNRTPLPTGTDPRDLTPAGAGDLAPADLSPSCVVEGCPPGRLCEPALGACVECVVDNDCPGKTPRCHPGTHVCVECMDNDGCPAEQTCVTDRCVQCQIDADCQRGNPSPASQGKARCATNVGVCVQCLTAADCCGGCICSLDLSCSSGCFNDSSCPTGMGCCPACKNQCAFCVRLDTVDNCGACGVRCAAGQRCCAGVCKDAC